MSERGSAARRKSASRKRRFCETDRSFDLSRDGLASDGDGSEVEDTIEMEFSDTSESSPMINSALTLHNSEPVRSDVEGYIREGNASTTEMEISDGSEVRQAVNLSISGTESNSV